MLGVRCYNSALFLMVSLDDSPEARHLSRFSEVVQERWHSVTAKRKGAWET